jgi:transposase
MSFMGTARCSGEFERDAVALVESSGRRVSSVARELGVNPESSRQWVARSRVESASGAGGEGPVSRRRVAGLMRELGSAGRHLRRAVRTTVTDRNVLPAPDLVGHDFTAPAPDVRWWGGA